MANIGDLEKKINSELTTKIKESEIKHNQLNSIHIKNFSFHPICRWKNFS